MSRSKYTNSTKLATPLLSLIFLSACSNPLECSNPDARKLTSEIAKENEFFFMDHGISGDVKKSEFQRILTEQANTDEKTIQENIYSIDAKIRILQKDCKSILLKSETLRKIESQGDSISSKIKEEEKINPVRPQPFFWKAGSTQQQHDAWAEAEAKYQSDVRKKDTSRQALYADREATLATLKASKDFALEVCDKATTREVSARGTTTVKSATDINKISEHTSFINRGALIPKELINESASYIATVIAPEVTTLSNEENKLLQMKDSLKSKISSEWAKIDTQLKSEISGVTYALGDIITSGKNENTGATTCKAKITGKFGQSEYYANITYLMEKTSDSNTFVTILKVY
jgi:hypothetical protein